MNDTLDVILVNRCNQNDDFRTVLPAKMCMHVLLIMVLAVLLLACVGAAAGATWVVDDDGGADFASIQAAVDAAAAGDTIEVASGTYVENVDVRKSLALIGDDADVVMVEVGCAGDHVFDVTADYVNISGFTVTGATNDLKAGIYLDRVDYCNISNNNASNNNDGISLSSSSNNKLADNIANLNSQCGIVIHSSSNNTLVNNTASNNDYGIVIQYSSNNTLMSNAVSNTIGGIILASSSDNNTLYHNTASLNNWGISLSSSSNNTLASNTASNNNDGICLWHSSDNNTLYHNNLIGNTQNAYDSCTNQWDSGTVGNYHSGYTGTDSDGDGIGDTPHPLPCGSSIDRFPLMQPWGEDTQQKGDLNGDGRITAADAIIALHMAVSGVHSDDADMDRDGSVTSLDALMVMRAMVESNEAE